jgi:Zn ribbon nucleic-acid-binding protein
LRRPSGEVPGHHLAYPDPSFIPDRPLRRPMRGAKLGRARFVCPDCSHAVAATWHKRSALYEGRCIRCGRWHRFRREGEAALPALG